MKKTEDIVPDIYGLLQKVIDGDTHVIAESDLFWFGEQCKFAVKRALRSRERGKRDPKTIFMSEAGKPCKRQLWYELHEETPKEKLRPENLVKFLYGDLLEALVLLLVKASGHEVTDLQKPLEIKLPNDWKIRGRIDAKIDGEIYDVKSTSSYAFKKFEEGTLEKDDPFGYLGQLGLYNEADGGQNPTGFLAIDKTLGKITRTSYPAESVPRALPGSSRERLVKDLEAPNPPERHYKDLPEGKSGNRRLGIECSYCSFKKTCWADSNGGSGLRTFVSSRGPLYLTEVKRVPKMVEVFDSIGSDT